MIKQYRSVAELRAHYISIAETTGKKEPWQTSDMASTSWFNNEKYEDTIRKTVLGDLSLVPPAEKLMSKLDLAIETPRKVWERSPAGAWPCVPDVIAGLPTPMRKQTFTGDERRPITILCITDSSGSIDAGTLAKRGTVIMALTMALCRIRPVSLRLVGIGNGKDGETITTAPINTSPLELATAAYFFSSSGFSRRLIYRVSEFNGGDTGRWPEQMNFYKPEKYYLSLAQRLTNDPRQTLVIGAAKSNDILLLKPLEWIKDQVKHFTQQDELV